MSTPCHGRSLDRRGRRALRRNRPSHRPLAPRTSTPSSTTLTANSVWWDGNRKMSKENFDTLLADFSKHAEGKKLFAQDLYGGADPKYRIKTRVFTEFAWHSLFIRQLLIRPERAELAKFRSRAHHRRSAVVQAGRQTSRRPRRLRHDGGDRFHPQDRADLRLVLCRRNEEVGVHHAQFLSAGAERRADALLGQCRPRGRERAVLRPVRHRQDHVVGRSEPHPDRRRRTRLGPGRHLQFRGRLLRQDHQALAGSRADDLGRHQPLRRGAGKRGVRSGHARAGLRRRLQDREYPLGLSARFHSERLAQRPRRSSEEHHLPDRRRLSA